MDALEPSEAMMALAAAKNVYTNYICDYLNSRETTVKNGKFCYLHTYNTLVLLQCVSVVLVAGIGLPLTHISLSIMLYLHFRVRLK